MALNKLDKTSEDHKMLETYPDEWAQVLMDLINKVNTGFDKTNEHINKVASMQTEINTEKNKTGISTAQADAITANTAKVGITTKQATLLTALMQSAIQLSSSIKGTTVASPSLTLIEGRKAGTYSLRIAVRITVNEGKTQVKYIDLPLT